MIHLLPKVKQNPAPVVAKRRIWVEPHRLIEVGQGCILRLFSFGHCDRLATVKIHGEAFRYSSLLREGEVLDCSAWLGILFIPVAVDVINGRAKRILLECIATKEEVKFA